jgi:epoxyqueuosine reductase
MDSLAHMITDEALAAGFATVGFAAAAPAKSMAIYRQWLADGMAGDMEYLHRHAELRIHPTKLATGVKSIIAVGARYPTNPEPGRGFSTYARGLDYHDIVRRKLRKLAAFIHDHQPLEVHRICVDSAPLLEREWAMRAGLGWQGKQGQLVSPTAGCCLVLGFLLVDIELPPSEPMAERCGDCHCCTAACPTGAALGEGRVDARRCLSYLTIEHKTSIPDELREPMAGMLFGCDCCTAVCPWNRRATAPIMPELEARVPPPSTQEILDMTGDAFDTRFKGTAVYRTGLERLKRNAALAARDVVQNGVPGSSKGETSGGAA